MTDKQLNKNSSLNAPSNPCCFNFDKRAFFVFRYYAFVLKWLPW